MLKFFRRIRKSLLKQNSFRKYLIYAVGEIALVMIGILLAIQVNNWNEKQNIARKNAEILKEIKRNVEFNIQQFNAEIQREKGVIQSINIIVENLEHKRVYHDSLDYHYLTGVLWSESNWKSSGYETLKAHGVDKLESIEVKEAILDLYEISYNKVSEAMRISEGYSYSVVTPVQTDLFMSKNAALEGAKPIDYEMILGSGKYKGVLTYWRGLRYFTIDIRNDANLKAKSLIKLIDEYLTN